MDEETKKKLAEQIRAEMIRFNDLQTTLEAEREEHTHWPMLDAVSSIVLDSIGQGMIRAIMENPSDMAGEMSAIHQELTECLFWVGYHFGKEGIEITECPSDHPEPQKPGLN